MSHPTLRAPIPRSMVERREEALPVAVEYADKTLRRVLGLGDGRLEVQAVRGGANSLVYFLSCHGAKRAVIYLHENTNNWRDTRDALTLGSREALPIPRLLHSRSGPLLPWRKGYAMLATDFAEGRTLLNLDWTPSRTTLLADTLAQLHRVESNRWGKLRRLRRGPLLNTLERGIRKRIQQIRDHATAPAPPVLDGIQHFFDGQLAGIPEPENFQLCHHHLFGDDLIISPDDKKMTILDCPGVQYSRASRDLASVRQGFFPNDDENWQQFLDAYFENFSSRIREEWEREIPVYDAFYLLVKLGNHMGKARQPEFLRRLGMACGMEIPAS